MWMVIVLFSQLAQHLYSKPINYVVAYQYSVLLMVSNVFLKGIARPMIKQLVNKEWDYLVNVSGLINAIILYVVTKALKLMQSVLSLFQDVLVMEDIA